MRKLEKLDPDEFRNKPRDQYRFIGDAFAEIIAYLNAITDAVNEINETLGVDRDENAD